MKKNFFYLFLIALLSLVNFLTPSTVSAETPKVYWDGIMMVKGQVGKIKVIKSINLWERTDKGLVFVRILKPGEQYRVYRYDNKYGGQYGLGANMYITKIAGYVDYKTPSKSKLAELEKVSGGTPNLPSLPSDAALYPTEMFPNLSIGKVNGQSITQIAPGVRKKVLDIGVDSNMQRVFTIDYDGTTANISLRSQIAKDQMIGFESTSSQANRVIETNSYHVVGGVNGDYFDNEGQPIDMMMMNGSLISTAQTPINELAVLGVQENGKVIIGSPKVNLNLTVNGGSNYQIDSINRKRSANHLVVYTRDFYPSTRTNELGTEVRVKMDSGKLNGGETFKGTVLEVINNVGNATLNKDEIILSGHHLASEYLKGFTVGDQIEIQTNFEPAEWNTVKEAVSGRYHLVKDGIEQNITTAGVNPRSAVGVRQNGSVFTVVVDGRRAGYSKGLTLQQTAKMMKEMNAYNAITFDGGGSSTLVTRELGDSKLTVANKPSDGFERAVSNTLLFVSKWDTSALYAIVPQYKTIELFQGGTYESLTVPVKGIDQYMNPVVIGGSGNAQLQSDAIKQIGTTAKVVGAPGIYNGIISAAGKSTSIQVKITNELDLIRLNVPYIQAANGQAINLVAEGLKGGAVVVNTADAFKWSISPNLGTISQGQFKASTNSGVGTISVTYGMKTLSIPVVVGDVKPTVLESFNKGTFNYIGTGDRANVTVVTDVMNERDGTKGLKISYDFIGQTGTSGAYVQAKSLLTISIPARKIGMWVKGDGSGSWLRSQIRDASGKVVQLDFDRNVTWTDWRFLEAEIPAGLNYPLKMDLPLRIMQTDGTLKTKGEFIIDDIQSIYK
ncbi:phosphodiester glycosidase family protein [Paenisporosarcina sp. NPDC076898]|uniref:phosphodiester glycosidase family protein n=1 Tax=unclassified Paenisporosarcina TaxID=2642018 RepID=UPI003D00938B